MTSRTKKKKLPRCRDDLVIRRMGEGEFVVKLPADGAYFRIGEVEEFLLSQMTGTASATTVRQAFEKRFGDPLSSDELDEFIAAVKPLGLFEKSNSSSPVEPVPQKKAEEGDLEWDSGARSILFYRRTLFNPDKLLNILEPPLRFLWTKTFVAVSAVLMLLALAIVWNCRAELVSNFPQSMRWEMFVLFWVTLVTVTMLHELAHGLTCKHYGGEVREIGVLLVFFTPCFFCNVSDAWLIPKKSHRLWVTLAGGYCDLCVWALAVFAWRLTVQDTLVNYVAWTVLSICGGRILFNFNPLMRLDGYYLFSDWLEVPNLRPRSTEYWMEHIRWIMWGAEKPSPRPRGRTMLVYGGLIWLFSLIFLDFVVFGLIRFLGGHIGIPGLIATFVLLGIASKRVFRGFFSSEFAKMIATRPLRTRIWIYGIVTAILLSWMIPVKYVATGEIEVRPGVITEVHTPVSGFVKKICHGEGDVVEKNTLIAELEILDLESQIVRKQAEVEEVEATLKRLKVGPRLEEVAEQKAKIRRAEDWRDMGKRDLDQARLALEHEISRLDTQVRQSETEVSYATNSYNRATNLYKAGALAGEQYRAECKRFEITTLMLAQSRAAKLAREADGVRLADAELARRNKELEDAKATLVLMQAGSRPEEIEAETARYHRLQEELSFLGSQRSKVRITSPAAGVIATPRMYERVGQLAELGSLICFVEDVKTLNVEISVAEDEVSGIQPGQSITLKVRALPFDKFVAKVDRIAPRAFEQPEKRQSQNTILVYCHVDNPQGKLKSGMTGVARINRGYRVLAFNLLNQAIRYVRTEFWW